MTQVERVFTASIGGRIFCGLIHITVLNWLVWYENFLLKFVLLFSTKNLLYWEELGYHMLISSSIYFSVNICSLKFQPDFWTSQPATSVLSRPRVLSATRGEGLTGAIMNDSEQHLEYPSG